MVSIFEAIDREVNKSLKFWGPLDETFTQDIEQNKIREASLQFLMPNGVFKTRNVVLTKTKMYISKKEGKEAKKMAVIIWKKIEPFCEESESEERFGFRLVQSGLFQDFYTKNPEELEEWLESLSRVSILNDLEEDYKTIREIGSGSYAKVLLVQDLQDNQEYAVKSINKDLIWNSSRSTNALINEINVMRKLNHPFLVKLHRVYENEKFVHLVLDYVPGGDLFHRLMERSVFTEEVASKFMRNMLEVLDYIHSLNIIHRDLKPENILMMNHSNDWEFKIADFGLACETHEEVMLRCGSPGYVAPEILKKHLYGKKVDIFSAGIILYVILSSRAPFFGKNASEILIRNKECKIYFQDRYWKNVSKEGIDCVLRLTDCDPDTRPMALEALRHPWFTITHNPKLHIESIIPPCSPNTGISAELMKRMNNKRYVEITEKERKEEEEDRKAFNAHKTVMSNNAKNLLKKLRDADSLL